MMNRFIAFLSAAILSFIVLYSCSEEEQQPSVVKVDSISIEQGDMTLTEGESVNLSAVVLPEDASDKTITWTSSDEATVIISSNGKAAGIAIGTVAVTAKAGEKSDFITITVVARPIPVTGISLDKPSLTIKVGEFEMLTPIITPENATNKNVLWTSSNDEVATVENGKVVGVMPGSAIIAATTEDGAKMAECLVTVKSNLATSVTVGVERITAICAKINGEANLESTTSSDLTMGIMWSTNSGVLPSNSTKIEATDIHAREETTGSYYYSVNIDNLDPATTYYFHSYVTQNGQDAYGETKEFKTKDIGSLIETDEASDIEATKATLNAKLDLTDVLYEDLLYGFYWGTSESSQENFISGLNVSDTAYLASLTELSHKTQYWYKAGVTIDSRTFHGEVKTLTTGVIKVESVSLNTTDCVLNEIGATLTLKAKVLPADATDKNLEWTSDNPKIATVDKNGKITAVSAGSAIIKAEAIDGSGITSYCNVSVVNEIVDLGLSVKWRGWNLGASKPEKYGAYYSWGEIYSKSNYSWSTYAWGKSNIALTKYNTISSCGSVDNKTEFKDYDYEDDAARQKLGGKWRIPTNAEWAELMDKCTCTFTDNYDGTGVKGLIVTAKNGNSLFLPAAGYKTDNTLSGAGKYGCYWSSSLQVDNPVWAWLAVYNSSDGFSRGGTYRYYGHSIRPVCEK